MLRPPTDYETGWTDAIEALRDGGRHAVWARDHEPRDMIGERERLARYLEYVLTEECE